MKPLLSTMVWLIAAGAGLAVAGVGEPSLGCFDSGNGFYEVLGVAGNFLARPIAVCVAAQSRWRVVRTSVDARAEVAWAERTDPVSGAIEARTPLGSGAYGVFPDGTVADFNKVKLPGSPTSWQVLGADWMVALAGGHWVVLNRAGPWFYLPNVGAGAAQ